MQSFAPQVWSYYWIYENFDTFSQFIYFLDEADQEVEAETNIVQRATNHKRWITTAQTMSMNLNIRVLIKRSIPQLNSMASSKDNF